MAVSSNDYDRLEHHFDKLSSARQQEIATDFDSFLSWIQTLKSLAQLIQYAVQLFKWLKKQYKKHW